MRREVMLMMSGASVASFLERKGHGSGVTRSIPAATSDFRHSGDIHNQPIGKLTMMNVHQRSILFASILAGTKKDDRRLFEGPTT